MLFDSLDLFGHINSTAFDEKSITDWVAADCQAHGIISQSVATDVLVKMRLCGQHETWDYF